MNEEEKKVLNVVRSLIISSRPRDGLSLRKLLDDFQDYEGKRLPLFEYKSAVDFLQASGEFDITNFGGEYIVYAKISNKSRHISKLVADQHKPRAYRHSVQNRLIQTNQSIFTRCLQRSPHQPHHDLHQGASTVFSFEELKAKERSSNEQIIYSQKYDEIVDKTAAIPSKEVFEDAINNVVVEYQQKTELPWTDEYWTLVITCFTSTTEIWGKLAGKHSQNDQYDSLTIEFQEEVLSNKKRATVLNVGQIYVTITRGIVNRIRMDHFDSINNRILCFFIDEGDKKWLPINEIYDCPGIFSEYPPQAICFSLDGFEDVSINNNEIAHTLLGKTLTGRILTTKEDFVSYNERKDTNKAIKLCLKERSGNFIEFLREIVRQMYHDVAVPNLVSMKLTPVNVSHIGNNGDIFCQLEQSAVDYVEKLITQFIRKMSNSPFRGSEDIKPTSSESLFIVHDPETNKFYRARVINEIDGGSNMFFVDYGHSKLVPLLYTISESIEEELYKYPPQAFRTKLYGVSSSTILVNRLRSHFALKRNAYVRKMQTSDTVEIKLYCNSDSFMVCINDSLELENERNRTIDSSSSAASEISETVGNSHSIVDQTFVDTVVNKPKIEAFLPPKMNSCFEISIVKTESPSNFVIKPTEHIPQWQKQMKALQSYCKETSSPMTLDMIKEGEPYACLKSNGFWYRAIIKFHRSKMFAFFCDIADIDNITDLNKIKFLPTEYHTIPKLAMTARLFGIEPINGTWEMDDNIQFHRITKGKKFMAEVIEVFHEKSEENSVLEIILRHKQDVLNDLFVTSGRAIKSKISQ